MYWVTPAKLCTAYRRMNCLFVLEAFASLVVKLSLCNETSDHFIVFVVTNRLQKKPYLSGNLLVWNLPSA